jgi:hypothetical protein
MAAQVAGDLYESITGQLFEIGRQVRQPTGYPFDAEGLKGFLQLAVEGKCNGIAAPAVKPKLLAPRAVTTVGPLDKRFEPKEFFRNRIGLYIWDSFSSHVLAQAKPSGPASEALFASFDLTRNAYYSEIKVPEGPEVELWHIAKLIEGQHSGGSGPLLNNGYANIFYFGGFVVSVNWYAGRAEWHVDGWGLVDDFWDAGHRVFSRN